MMGRPPTDTALKVLSRDTGLSNKSILRLGGSAKLTAMDPDARALLINATLRYRAKQLKSRGTICPPKK